MKRLYLTHLLSTVVRRFMSVLICSACLDQTFSKLVKDSCIISISIYSCVVYCDCCPFVTISGYLNICHFDSPEFFCGAAGFSVCCRRFLVI
jgi:hypothetical protein